MLARVANRELPLLFGGEFDFLCNMINDLLLAGQPTVRRFVRDTRGATPCLIELTTTKDFDPCGRLCTVITPSPTQSLHVSHSLPSVRTLTVTACRVGWTRGGMGWQGRNALLLHPVTSRRTHRRLCRRFSTCFGR
jgi:hypothetical protein